MGAALKLREDQDAEIQRLKDQIEELKSLLGFDHVGALRFMGFTNKEAGILCLLLKRAIVSRENIYTALYVDVNIDERPEFKTIDAFVCRIREKLRVLTPLVEVNGTWGFGYSIDRTGREALLAEMRRRMLI